MAHIYEEDNGANGCGNETLKPKPTGACCANELLLISFERLAPVSPVSWPLRSVLAGFGQPGNANGNGNGNGTGTGQAGLGMLSN